MIARVAQAIDKDKGDLEIQYEYVMQRARPMTPLVQTNSTNKDVLKQVLDRVHASRTNVETTAFQEAAILYNVVGISSSGLEQNFAKGSWGFSNRQLKAQDHVEEFTLKCILDLPHHNTMEVITLAQRVWTIAFPPARSSEHRAMRLDKGVSKLKACSESVSDSKLPTEAQFIRKRRRSIADNVNHTSDVDLDVTSVVQSAKDAAATSAHWTPAHDKELEFQQNKIAKRKAQALEEGVLLQDECSADLKKLAKDVRAQRIHDERARVKKKSERDSKVCGITSMALWGKLNGKKVYFDNPTPELHHCAATNHMVPIKSVLDADMFVLKDLMTFGQKIKVVSSFKGCWHVSEELVSSCGARGVAIKFTPKTISRTVFVSQSCRNDNSDFWAFFTKALAAMHFNWVVKFGGEDVSIAPLKTKFKGRPAQLIAVVKGEELLQPVDIHVAIS